ncbi:CsgG/HfaB family protein [Desulfobacterium sp. N47]|uniref:CsgG/HfaB family protein n=1 Tax=Desulfobacterium sp. N47 TaxID=3115210 RepID=UPI003C97B09C
MIKKAIYFGLIFLLAGFLFSCAAGKQDFEVGMKLRQAGKNSDAISYLEKAIANEPNNAEYKKALAELKESIISDYISLASNTINAKGPVTITSIKSAKANLAKAKEIDPNNPSVIRLSEQLDKQENSIISKTKILYEEAKASLAAEEWVQANTSLRQIQEILPNYLDSSQLLEQTSKEGSEAFYNKAKVLFGKDDLKGASKILKDAISLNPNHSPSLNLLVLIKQRDNKEYFVDKGRKAVSDQNWAEALKSYNKALEYSPNDESLKSLISVVLKKLGTYYVETIRNQMADGWYYKAFETYNAASKNVADPNATEFRTIRNELSAQANSMATRFKDQKKYGTAWFWYSKLKNISPDYPEIFANNLAMEDKIRQRVQKSIAVFDFSSPSQHKDPGIIVANNLITYLFKNASGDIKILERENLKSILEEMKLGQIGVVSEQTAKEMGRVYGIDVAVMGSVLLYQVETSVSNGTKTARYQIGTEIQDNIEYLNWATKNPNPTHGQLASAPPAKISSPKYTEKDYAVSNHKKVGFVQLSFRIVDVKTGENIQVRTIERKETVEDDTSAGLPEANVKYDPLVIPTDTELLQKMTGEVVAELGREALKPLNNLEKTYFQDGEQYLKRRERIQAAESFVDAVFDEKMKMVLGSPLTIKAMENLDNIFRNYKEN